MQTELLDTDSAAPTGFPATLPGAILSALERRGFAEPTAVQSAVCAAAGHRVDLQISSETGSGKTVALGILLAQRLLADDAALAGGAVSGQGAPRALVITPTRELAAQVQRELEWLYADLAAATVAVVTGGTSVSVERRALRRRPSIVVGTPGRMLDHMRSGVLEAGAVAEVVLDEADQMLDMGFREELEGILDATPETRGTHLVSATFPREIQRLAERYQRAPRQVEGTRLGEVNGDIEHVAHLVHARDRYAALVNLLLLAGHQRTLVFVNTRRDTAELAAKLAEDGFSAMALSGELQQAQRTRTLAAFRDGAVNVLVATDVAARGLDVPEIDTVIQASTPMDSDVYVHRSGRTGRAGRKGRSVLLVPTLNERRVRRLLARAGVEAGWSDVPNARRVRKKLVKRGRRRLLQAIDGSSTVSENELEYARLLLEGRDPAQVVAALVAAATPGLVREPMELQAPRPERLERPERPERAERHSNGDRTAGGARPAWSRNGVGAVDRSSRPRQRASGHGHESHVRFAVNWGFHGGANPRRLMALICRRGDITSRMVGRIKPGPTSTTFEIREQVAADFESRAQRPDPRDPKLSICRVSDEVRSAGSPR